MPKRQAEPYLVEIGTARDPMEGGLIREYLAGYDIDCVVQGEHHSSLLGSMGAFIPLRLLVPSERAEEAQQLLRDLREGPDAGEPVASDQLGEDEGDDDLSGDLVAWRDDAELVQRVRRARMLALVLPGLGLGHLSLGARVRWLVLASAWPLAVYLGRASVAWAIAAVAISTAVDLGDIPAAATDLVARRRAARRKDAAVRLPRAQARRRRR